MRVHATRADFKNVARIPKIRANEKVAVDASSSLDAAFSAAPFRPPAQAVSNPASIGRAVHHVGNGPAKSWIKPALLKLRLLLIVRICP